MTTERLVFATSKMAASSGLEAEYWAAIVRILNPSAQHPSKKKNPQNSVLSQSAVAREAGHSRTPISGKNCKFPEVRDFLALRPSNPTSDDQTNSLDADGTRLSDIIHSLRQDLAAVRLERDIFATRIVEAENIVAIRDREIEKMKKRKV